MTLYIIYLKFIAKYLFKYGQWDWLESLWRKWMVFLLLEPYGCALLHSGITHTHTQLSQRRHKWGRDFSTSIQVFCINSEYLEIHGFGSTKCLRANRYIGAGHFRKHWKGSADVDANLLLRDKHNQTDNRTNCQNKALIISVLVLCSSTCGPQLSYDAAYYPGILLVRLAIAFQLLYFHTKKKEEKKLFSFKMVVLVLWRSSVFVTKSFAMWCNSPKPDYLMIIKHEPSGFFFMPKCVWNLLLSGRHAHLIL